jgi:hypothetical protein
MNKDSLLRAAGDKILLASATMGGSCAYPDQSRGLARVHNLRAISVLVHPTPFYPFSSWVVQPLHGCLVGEARPRYLYPRQDEREYSCVYSASTFILCN